MILGIDEVGRGPWAGPLVVGAVVLGNVTIEGLTDSKKISKKHREELNELIRGQAAGYGLGWVSAAEIDQIGLSAALQLATVRAVEQIKVPYHEIMIDGTVNFLRDTSKGRYVTTLKKADLLIPSVSAASIIAKVARDNFMTEQDTMFPGYHFASHVGYGTAAHRAAIEKFGVTPLHRLSFAPLRQYGPGEDKAAPHSITVPTTKQIGDRAEEQVANDLMRRGHTIIARNWKTRWCEIDIISLDQDTLYFTEVKYRKNAQQGGAIAAITPKKLQQMKFATEYYVNTQKAAQYQLRLAVATVTGPYFTVEDWIKV